MHPKKAVELGDRKAVILDASWEGEGAIAIYRAQELEYLLHFDESETFTDIRFEYGRVIAESGGYPEKFIWEINETRPLKIFVRLAQSPQ